MTQTTKTVHRRETAKHREAFEAWYASSKRDFGKIMEVTGKKKSTLYEWSHKYNWYERADARDAEAGKIVEEKAIAEKIKRLDAHLKSGTALRHRVFWCS